MLAVLLLHGSAEEYTANMQLEGESRATGNADAIVDRVSAMTNEEFERECLEAKMASRPDDYQACLKKAKPELKGLRNERSKRQMKEPIVFRVGENATKLEYPRDVPQLLEKKGETYNPHTEKTEHHTLAWRRLRHGSEKRRQHKPKQPQTAKMLLDKDVGYHNPKQSQLTQTCAMVDAG